MRFQKIVATNGLKEETLPDSETHWTVSQADAATKRAALVDQGYRRKDIETTAVDVPTDKQGLLEWLNQNVR
jgi:hypothetical protein